MDRRQFLATIGGGAAVLTMAGEAEARAPLPAFHVLGHMPIPRGVGGSSRKVALAARPGGGYAALWETDTGQTYTPSYLRFYGADLKPIGVNRLLARTTYGGDGAGNIVFNRNGTALAFFFGWPYGSIDLFWAQRISATGEKIGKPIKLDDSWDGDYPHAVRLTSGNILAVWRGYGTNQAKVLSPIGQTVAVNAGAVSDGALEEVAALPNGGAVVGFYDPEYRAAFQRLDAHGKRVGQPITQDALYASGGMTVAAHPRGFVAIWKNADDKDEPVMDGAIFDVNGNLLVKLARQKLPHESRWGNFYVQALSLPGGAVVVCAGVKRRPNPSGSVVYSEIIGYRFNPNGTRHGIPTTLYSRHGTASYLNRPRSLIHLRDGRFMLGYDAGAEYGINTATAVIFK